MAAMSAAVTSIASQSLARGVARRLQPVLRPRPASLATAAAAASSTPKESVQELVVDLEQKFGRMGVVSHRRVGVQDLFRVLRACRKPEDFQRSLSAMNRMYNYGVKLQHRELASRLLAAAMVCGQEQEAVEMIRLGGTWLEHPPDKPLIYALMGHFLDAGQPLVVREIAKAAREDWRIRPEPPLYSLCIAAMLRLPEAEGPIAEALAVHGDAGVVGVRLPAPVHLQLLDAALAAHDAEAPSEEGEAPTAGANLVAAARVAAAMSRDGHLHGGAAANVLCSLAWLSWRVGALSEAARAQLVEETGVAGALALREGRPAALLEEAVANFGCHWGFSAQLPRGFFAALEAAASAEGDDAAAACSEALGGAGEAARLVAAARTRFDRFYPSAN
eukprot:TRINITY_DN23612_c0_g1_i1.p1 TRINITY_DN23612_c0_g1~~TRINITY_DN23612_c0_g1_i1.p1  ORF type:complete len:414 (-),score=97.42 TRINITY_DN23612_c0_g1_i1:50-1219(-)